MESPLPFALRVAAGVVAESLDVVRRLPTDLSTLPVSVMGRVAKLSFQLNQQLTELATSGDRLLAGMGGEEQPPERTAWSTIDDEDEVAEHDPQAAATWDSTSVAVDDEAPIPPDLATTPPAADRVAAAQANAAEHPTEHKVPRRIRAVPDMPAVSTGPDEITRELVGDVQRLENQPPPPRANRTLAELRTAARTMTVTELEAALEAEQLGGARPAHLTLLSNRLATLGGTSP